jgi:hypothetical protein
MKKSVALVLGIAVVGVTSCTSSSSVRTSQNTAIVQTSAAPVCGGTGASKVAEKEAAIETLKAGFDRYIIVGAASADNVRATRMPGSYNTFGTVNSYGGMGTFNATTTYQPGPVVIHGHHDQSFAIKMFHDGEPGANQAISAKSTLGPEWQKIVKNGIHSCMG